MTINVLNIWGEMIGVIVGGLIFLIFGIFLSAASRQIKTLPGSAGRREDSTDQQAHDEDGEQGGETILADGFIDSFGGVIEESGGGAPLLVKIALIGIPVWMILYLILNWSQVLLSMRTFYK